MTVSWNPEAARLSEIKRAVADAGYEAEDEHVAAKEREIRSLLRRFAISAAATLPLLYIAMGHTLGLPVAAGLLHLFGGPLLNPMLAAAALSLSSVSGVSNALRLRRFK